MSIKNRMQLRGSRFVYEARYFRDFIRMPTLDISGIASGYTPVMATFYASMVSCGTLLFGFLIAVQFGDEQLGKSSSLQSMYELYGGALGLLFVNGIVGPVLEELVFRNALCSFSASKIMISSTILSLFLLDRTQSSVRFWIMLVYSSLWIGFFAQIMSTQIRIALIRYWNKHFSGVFVVVTVAFVVGHYSPSAVQDLTWEDSGLVALGFADRLLLSSLAGYLRVRTGSLVAPITVHSAPNMLLAILFLLLKD